MLAVLGLIISLMEPDGWRFMERFALKLSRIDQRQNTSYKVSPATRISIVLTRNRLEC